MSKSKTKLSIKEVEHIAELSQLTLTNQELRLFAKEMTETLDYIHNLDQIDTKKVRPTYQTTGIKNRFATEQTNSRILNNDQALSNTKKKKNGYFRIKGFNYTK